MSSPSTPSAKSGNFCKTHRQGGIQSMTVSAKPCEVCGQTPTKSGFAKRWQDLEPGIDILPDQFREDIPFRYDE